MNSNRQVYASLIIRFLQQIALYYLIIWFLLFLFRLAFVLLFKGDLDIGLNLEYLAKAFWLGARFDLQTLAYINALPVLLMLVGYLTKGGFKQLRISVFLYFYLFIMSVLLIIIQILDYGYFYYFQEHITPFFFDFFTDDTWALLVTIAREFPIFYVGILLALLILIIRYVAQKILLIPITNTKQVSTKIAYALPIVIIFINFLLMRGTVSLFPLSYLHKEISPVPFINEIPLNGATALFHATQKYFSTNKKNFDPITAYGFESRIENAISILIGKQIKTNSTPLDALIRKTRDDGHISGQIKPHVLVIVMEGLGTHWVLESTEKFDLLGDFKKHIYEDYIFTNFLPSTGYSAGSIASILSNLPVIPQHVGLTESEYSRIPLLSSPAKFFNQNGYETSFVYGGNIGWRNIDTFSRNQGYQKTEGMEAIKTILNDGVDYEHPWGVYDEFLFDYLLKKLTDATRPQFIVAFTTSNHPPYQIPATYRAKPLEIPQHIVEKLFQSKESVIPRLQTLQYANQKLGEFLTAIKKSTLKDRVIIAVTGDHNFSEVYQYGANQFLDRYSVPFYLYIPMKFRKKQINTRVFGSHKDIMPTLYQLSVPNAEYLSIGTDLLSNTENHFGFFYGHVFHDSQMVSVDIASATCYQMTGHLQRYNEKMECNSLSQEIIQYYKAAMAVTSLIKNLSKDSFSAKIKK